MKVTSRKIDWIVLYHVVLIGVSSLVPFPFLDDLFADYFERRLVGRLARSHGVVLSSRQIRQLAQQHGFGCLTGCSLAFSYIVQEVIQTFLPWLKWQRAVDRATEAYYSGYLWNSLFGSASFDGEHPAQYGKAVQNARKGTNTELVKNLIRATFNSSRGLVLDISRGLFRLGMYSFRHPFWFLARRRRVGDEDTDQFTEDQQPGIRSMVEEVTGNLMEHLSSVPQGHFDRLNDRLRAELEREGLERG